VLTEKNKTMEKSEIKIAVLGAGHGGSAMAGHLAIMGYNVNLYNRNEERIWGIKSTGGIEVKGEIEGFGKLNLCSTSIQDVIEGVDLIMVVVPAYAHRWLAEQVSPFLTDGQIIILHPGRTFGALEFKQVLNENNVTADVIIAEAQTFIYASRVIGPGQVRIFKIKNSVPVASIRAHLIPKVLKKLKPIYSQFVAGDNIFKTSFDNIGSIFHPTISLLNTGWIEDNAEFDFYHEGVTMSVAKVLEKVDAERIEVAEALGIRAMSALQWLYVAYNTVGANLYESIHKNPGYQGIKAPRTLKMRYIEEDVPFSLVPIASTGRMLGVETPAINTLISLASITNERDFCSTGRTVERLGIDKMSLRELRLLAIGETK
jgi:opine dehydrogenase